jgi:Predicted xylanase/chitin deacetylase
MRLLDQLGVRASALLNSDCCLHYPQIVEEVVGRHWACVAHGKSNSVLHWNLEVDEERRLLDEIVETIERTTGARPHGWLGPVLTESFNTPRLLGDLGFNYILDWCSDDQPFPLRVPGHRMIGVPYSIEVNDITVFPGTSASGEDFYRMIVDQFDVLYEESEESGRVVALALHPFISNQPFRHPYLAKALEHIVGHPGVWVTTSDEIADWYLANCYDRDVPAIAAISSPGG